MRNQDFRNKKISLNLLMWLLVVFVFFSLNQLARNYQFKKELSKFKKDMKKEIEDRIKKRDEQIYQLRKDNNFKRIQIEKMNQKIDSLEKVKNKIFGLHQKFHEHKDSHGIGLYLVYNHVTDMGDQIEVESEIGKGTTFIIKLK